MFLHEPVPTSPQSYQVSEQAAITFLIRTVLSGHLALIPHHAGVCVCTHREKWAAGSEAAAGVPTGLDLLEKACRRVEGAAQRGAEWHARQQQSTGNTHSSSSSCLWPHSVQAACLITVGHAEFQYRPGKPCHDGESLSKVV